MLNATAPPRVLSPRGQRSKPHRSEVRDYCSILRGIINLLSELMGPNNDLHNHILLSPRRNKLKPGPV